MKSLEEAIGYDFQCFDSRDKVRLIGFVPKEKLLQTGWLKKDANLSDLPKTKSWTRENVLEQLKEDVLFGWEKCSDERGISSKLMYECVKFWNWVLEEGLESFDDYGSYGAPMFKETAKKYGWELI